MAITDYAHIKLVNEQSATPLKFGDFSINRTDGTMYVGAGNFPLNEEVEAEGMNEGGDTNE